MSTIKLTEDDCRNVAWTVVEIKDGYRRSVGHGTHPVTGLPITVQRTEAMVEPQLLEANLHARNDTTNIRWSSGAGSEKGGNVPMVLIARTPLNKWLSDHAQAKQQGDKDFDAWWLNRPENAPFRTRDGTI